MATLQISLETAKNLYPTASPEFQAMLNETFGKKTFQKSIIERINEWEDVAEEAGIHPVTGLPFPKAKEGTIQAWLNDVFRLDTLNTVLNEGWIPNWDNQERKHYPYFDHSGGGFRFYDYRYDYSRSVVGGRLVYRTPELTIHAGTKFVELYKRVQTRPHN